ncbi:MAG: amidohydrolase family protein, partial [Anaerolineales bacterium]|nr:amidohydrolase family protein [Anaerolineales bacterium]
ISETADEAETCMQEHAMPVVHWLRENGVLDTYLVAAHCVHITESEMQLLKNNNAGIIHNPTSNLKLASGIAPVDRMLKMDLLVGIGTDGAASNNDLDFFEEVRLAALLAKGASGDPTAMPAQQALSLATIGGAQALHLENQIGSLVVGKKADLAVVDLGEIHNTPTFHRDHNAIYAQLVYAIKSTDVNHVLVNGRWLMRDKVLLTLDTDEIQAESQELAERIDRFLIQREKSVLSKLLVIGGVKQEESFEVQAKGILSNDAFDQVQSALSNPEIKITKRSHYLQFDSYFIFSTESHDSERLRFREDQVVDKDGNVVDARNRLTLIGPTSEKEFPNAVMLSRSRYIAPADKSLRFYQEYFQPEQVHQIEKDRHRWRIRYKNTNFAVNLDRLIRPFIENYFIEIKARTWSERDADRKAALIIELIDLFGKFEPVQTFPNEYINI